MKQPGIIARYLSHQDVPGIMRRYPRLLYPYFWLNRISVLRMKYAERAIRLYLAGHPRPRIVVDAGCGLGDHLFTVPEFRSAERLVGVDISPSNIEVCRALAGAETRTNTEFLCSDLATAALPADTDLVLFIDALMYIRDDRSVLQNIHSCLNDNGRLLLYVAVNYRRRLSLYKRMAADPAFDYDSVLGRPQTYSDESLELLLKECGFTVVERHPSFGRVAATMFEISSIFEWQFKSRNPISWLFLLPLYCIFYPFYLLAMAVDLRTSRSTGNGVMITARKA